MNGPTSHNPCGSSNGPALPDPAIVARQAWLRCLAHADPDDLDQAWQRLADAPTYELIRVPETGLAMVRGKTGEFGLAFNLGEMTVTRCAVRLAGGQIGVGYVAGRSKRHALLVALFDGILQDSGRRSSIHEGVIVPLEAAQAHRRDEQAARIVATKVEFFTMTRGD